MISSLHKRLALFMAVVIGAVLVVTTLAALMASERQMALREQLAFDAQVDSLAQDVEMGRTVKDSALAKLEVTGRLILSIWDNHQPISFRGGWQGATPRDALIERALSAAGGGQSTWSGAVRGDAGERYLASVRPLGGYRANRMVVALKDMRLEDAQRTGLRMWVALIAALGLALLGVFSYLFTRHALRPIDEAHARQNQFVAAASHELRTPLQVMWTATDAIRHDATHADEFAAQLEREIVRMRRLSDDLLLMTASPTRNVGPVEVEALVADAVASYRAAAEQQGIALTHALPDAPYPIIEGEEVSLRRMLNVLIDNAICYTEPGGHVRVSARKRPGHIEFSVEDDGPGIAEEHRAHIFDQFYRADKSRTDRAHNGLGLSIASQIAARHMGHIAFEPAQPRGSRFVATIRR